MKNIRHRFLKPKHWKAENKIETLNKYDIQNSHQLITNQLMISALSTDQLFSDSYFCWLYSWCYKTISLPLSILIILRYHLSWCPLASHRVSVWRCYRLLTAQTAKYVQSQHCNRLMKTQQRCFDLVHRQTNNTWFGRVMRVEPVPT